MAMIYKGNLNWHIKNALVFIICLASSCEKSDPIAPVVCNLTKQISPNTLTTYTYDDKGLLTAIDYDIKTTNGSSIKSKAVLEYDNSNRIVKIIGENAYTTYDYLDEERVHLETVFHRKTSTDPFAEVYSRTFVYNDNGLITKVMLDESNYKRYEYDEYSNVIRIFEMCALCNPIDPTEKIKFEYLSFDDKNRPSEKNFESNSIEGVSGFFERMWRTDYNPVKLSNHNVLRLKSHQSNGTVITHDVTYTYNQFGYPVQSGSIQYEYDCK